jgi:hypothetical protein
MRKRLRVTVMLAVSVRSSGACAPHGRQSQALDAVVPRSIRITGILYARVLEDASRPHPDTQ